MLTRPAEMNLANWRLPENSPWAFHHVREIVPSEQIACGGAVDHLDTEPNPAIGSLSLDGPGRRRLVAAALARRVQ